MLHYGASGPEIGLPGRMLTDFPGNNLAKIRLGRQISGPEAVSRYFLAAGTPPHDFADRRAGNVTAAI